MLLVCVAFQMIELPFSPLSIGLALALSCAANGENWTSDETCAWERGKMLKYN